MVSVHSMVLGLTAATAAFASADESLPVRVISSFDYASLASGDAPQRLLQALTSDGIVALKNIPNYANLREDFFRRAAECALQGYESPSETTPRVSRKLFSDGTKRYTISTNAGRELAASVEAGSFSGCTGYKERYLAFSQALEHAVNTFGSTLDATSFRVSDGHKTISSRQLVSEAVRLDHFHAYEAAPSSEAHRQLEEMSLPLHEDHGLFIAMSAPKFFEVDGSGRRLVERELASDASGLIIQTPSGQRVRPVLNADEVVIMMGTGASRWLKTSHAIPAVMHGMKMPEPLVETTDAGRRALRAWFGKMTLLPTYQRMLENSIPFESHVNATTRYLLTNDQSDLRTVGCATGRHLAASEGSCTLRSCTLKAGATAPEESCSVICNRQGHSASDATDCAAKCTCTDSSSPAERCWMLCVANLATSECALDSQTCSGQSVVCSASPSPTTASPGSSSSTSTSTTPAPASSSNSTGSGSSASTTSEPQVNSGDAAKTPSSTTVAPTPTPKSSANALVASSAIAGVAALAANLLL